MSNLARRSARVWLEGWTRSLGDPFHQYSRYHLSKATRTRAGGNPPVSVCREVNLWESRQNGESVEYSCPFVFFRCCFLPAEAGDAPHCGNGHMVFPVRPVPGGLSC